MSEYPTDGQWSGTVNTMHVGGTQARESGPDNGAGRSGRRDRGLDDRDTTVSGKYQRAHATPIRLSNDIDIRVRKCDGRRN
jgi:hypothetical protein